MCSECTGSARFYRNAFDQMDDQLDSLIWFASGLQPGYSLDLLLGGAGKSRTHLVEAMHRHIMEVCPNINTYKLEDVVGEAGNHFGMVPVRQPRTFTLTEAALDLSCTCILLSLSFRSPVIMPSLYRAAISSGRVVRIRCVTARRRGPALRFSSL